MKYTVKICALFLITAIMLTCLASCGTDVVGQYLGGVQNGKDDGYPPNHSGHLPTTPGYMGNLEDSISADGLYSDMEQSTPNIGPCLGSQEGETGDYSTPQGGIDSDDSESPFIPTALQAVSTFSADVDTASYAYFRKVVNASYGLPDLQRISSSFRVEEFLNYFKYDVPAPTEGELFGVQSEIIPCPWDTSTMLMRLTLQAPIPTKPTGNNLVFLIDVSGSMMSDDKLPLLKTAFTYLVGNLGANDTVSIVTYSGKEEVVLEGCSGLESERILAAINSLRASGSTNGEAGLSEAYRIAEAHMIAGGNNRIIMASDGDLNVGISSADDLRAYVEGKRDQGIYLSVLGFGSGNYRDANMEALADNGNGVYYYIDGASEAEKIFGTDLLGTLYTVAKDVKLQIKFDPEYISAYRLIGYENRMLREEDFNDDTKDAGDVGAGHQVTVCYELKCTETACTTEADTNWMELAIRYKMTDALLSQETKYSLGSAHKTATPSDDMRFLACVIQTVKVLKEPNADSYNLGLILEALNALDLERYSDRAEFRELIDKLV